MLDKYFKNKTFAVIAPAGRIDRTALDQAAKIWQSWGAKIKIMPHVTGFEEMFFSAPAELRAADINSAAADDEVDFIICARGGYGCAELENLIDWELLKKNPRHFIGYSDITALHQMLLRRNCGIPTVGAMFIKAPELFAADQENAASFIRALSGEKQIFKINADQPFHGKCIVGNLTVLSSLCGTDIMPDFDSKCLITEDLNEPPYKIHRMLNQLAQNHIFERISALGTGDFLNCGDNGEVEKIFRAFAERYDLPLYTNIPIGHGDRIHAVNMLNDISLI